MSLVATSRSKVGDDGVPLHNKVDGVLLLELLVVGTEDREKDEAE
jgi:hypothetical protein